MHTYIYTYFSSFIINIYKKNKKLCLISSCLICSPVISLVQLDSKMEFIFCYYDAKMTQNATEPLLRN